MRMYIYALEVCTVYFIWMKSPHDNRKPTVRCTCSILTHLRIMPLSQFGTTYMSLIVNEIPALTKFMQIATDEGYRLLAACTEWTRYRY